MEHEPTPPGEDCSGVLCRKHHDLFQTWREHFFVFDASTAELAEFDDEASAAKGVEKATSRHHVQRVHSIPNRAGKRP